MFRPPASARGGTGHAPSGAQIAAHRRRFSPWPLHTKFCVQKIPGQKNTGRGRRGTAPARKTGGNDAQNPLKCHQKAPALTRGGQKEGFPIPNGQQIGRKWAIKCRRAVCPSGRGQTVPRWRRSADNAASSPRKRRQFRPRSPSDTCKICHPGGIRPPESSVRAGTCWESASALPPRMCRPVALLVRHRHPPPPSRMAIL